MSVVIVTGSGGLIGSQAVRHFASLGLAVVGVDNDMRAIFFGVDASTASVAKTLTRDVSGYAHYDVDIRSRTELADIWRRYGRDVTLVVHTAAQPSHDWAAREPLTDFDVNAVGTLNVLEVTRQHAPNAALVHCSTNKVYGDRPNQLPVIEWALRYDIDADHQYANGIDESMSVDNCLHSLFGVSKLAADVAVQEYGRYFGMPTGVFRGGCLTGAGHQGAPLHGFLAYLVMCVAQGDLYQVIGYGGKQVRDIIHAADVVSAFEQFWRNPRPGEVYNIGGGVDADVSVLEALMLAEQATGRIAKVEYSDEARRGDHRWYVSDTTKFRRHYPGWKPTRTLNDIIDELADRWAQ